MADVARKAGVSAMTVSRALKDDQSVSAKTRTRIMKVIEELGYVLDLSAGALSSKRTGFVSVLIPSINNSNFSETMHAISSVMETADLHVLIGYSDYSVQREEVLIETMLRRRPEGIILTGGFHTPKGRRMLERADIPVIETWDLPPDPVRHVVGFSNAETIVSLMRRLYERGYQKIGFICGEPPSDARGMDRKRGYLQAVDELGLARAHVVFTGQAPISIKDGAEGIVRMIEEWPDVEAVICVSDLVAFGAMTECLRRGWDVPGRLAIAGFGDFEISRFAWPSLTTVSVGCAEIGRRAGELMLEAIKHNRDGSTLPVEIQQVPYEVVERQSTGTQDAPPKAPSGKKAKKQKNT